MLKLLILLIVPFAFIACDKGRPSTVNNSSSMYESNSIRTNDSEKIVAEPATITLKRTACNGSCPVYKLTIRPDGTTIFDGRKYTAVTGRQEGKIDHGARDVLISRFQSLDFSRLLDKYDRETCPSLAKDHATAIVSFEQGGTTKTVTHDLGCLASDAPDRPFPPGLTELENAIDEAAQTAQFIKIS